MVRRVCRELGTKKNIIVINDEAHHCYRRQARRATTETLTGDERHEAAEARRGGPRLDLRPRGRQGQDRRQGRLRPLGHAVLPARLRLPRRDALPLGRLRLLADRRHRVRHRQGAARARRRRLDDRRAADLPRPLAAHPRRPAEEGPQDRRGRRRAEAARRAARRAAQPLRQLREVLSRAGRHNADAQARGLTPPVFIVVCNNTNVSKLVFDYIAGWDEAARPTAQTVVVPGSSAALQQRRATARWSARPNTILVDQRAARVRRGDERRLQEDRRRARSRSSRPSTAPAFPAATPTT